MMRFLAPALAVAFACALSVGTAVAQSPIIIKFSHVVANDTPKGKGSLKFKELAEKYTDGKVKIEVYANSTLYKDNEEVEALQLGAVQMLAPSLAKFGPLGAKEFEVFDLPYIFQSKEALRRVTYGPIGKELFAKLDSKGILGVAYWDNGFKIMTANHVLKTPDDMLGLKMRIQSSKVLEAEIKAFGGVPQVLAFSESYQALQTGVVDGTENTPSNIYTQKMHEVQKYGAITNHGYIGYAVIVNKKFWEGLPADIRGQLDKAVVDATEYTNAIAQKENDDAMESMKKSGRITFYTPTPAEMKQWVAAAKPVWTEMAGRVGKDLIEKINAATAGAN
jgi:C4-dicarboxylate-binding protein DctP